MTENETVGAEETVVDNVAAAEERIVDEMPVTEEAKEDTAEEAQQDRLIEQGEKNERKKPRQHSQSSKSEEVAERFVFPESAIEIVVTNGMRMIL